MSLTMGAARVDPLQCERLPTRPPVADIPSASGDLRPTIRPRDARSELDAAADRVGAK